MHHRNIEDKARQECDSCTLPDCYPHSALCAAPLKQARKTPSTRMKILELLAEYGPLNLETIAYDLDIGQSRLEYSLDTAIKRGEVVYKNGGYMVA